MVNHYYLCQVTGNIKKYLDKDIKSLHKGCNGMLPKESQVKALIALCKLICLRDKYNEGSEGGTWIIYKTDTNIIALNSYAAFNCILNFKTAELRNQFHENFKDLIEEAKELL